MLYPLLHAESVPLAFEELAGIATAVLVVHHAVAVLLSLLEAPRRDEFAALAELAEA